MREESGGGRGTHGNMMGEAGNLLHASSKGKLIIYSFQGRWHEKISTLTQGIISCKKQENVVTCKLAENYEKLQMESSLSKTLHTFDLNTCSIGNATKRAIYTFY